MFVVHQNKELPIHFGMAAATKIQKIEGLNLAKLANSVEGSGEDATVDENVMAEQMEPLLRVIAIGLNEGARRAKLPHRYEWEDVGDMIDDNPELLMSALSSYSDANKVDLPEGAEKK